MLSSNDIKNVKLSKAAVGGYKAEEVELLLNKIVADYEEYESRIKKFQTKLEEANGTVEQFKKEKGSINNVLVSAQQLADNTVAEANKKAEKIIADANAKAEEIKENSKKLKEELDAEDATHRQRLEKEMQEFIKVNELKRESILVATNETIEKQQALFDKLRIDVAQFKEKALAFYEDGISVVKSMPDAVPTDPTAIAKAAQLAVEEEIDAKKIAQDQIAKTQEPVKETEEVKEETLQTEETKENTEDTNENKEETEEKAEKPIKRSFFGKKNSSEG